MATRKRSPAKPLVISRSGYLYAGGKIDRSIEGSPTVGQMYAEFWIPQTLRCPYPVVMIHGNWQTGTNFTGTPDGGEGWAQYFLRRGYAVYVADQVARGRSPHFSMSQGEVGPADLGRTERRFTAAKNFGLWPQATAECFVGRLQFVDNDLSFRPLERSGEICCTDRKFLFQSLVILVHITDRNTNQKRLVSNDY